MTVTVSDPEVDGHAAAADLKRVIEDERPDLLFPTTDKSILALLSLDDDRHPRALPDPEALDAAWNKSTTLAKAASLGIPIPDTRECVTIEYTMEVANELGWPLIVKPLRSHTWSRDGGIETNAVRKAHSSQELELILAENSHFPLLVQEWLPGHGVGIELLADEGSVLAAFQHRRLHELPLGGGMSSLRRAEVADGEMLDFAQKLMDELRWTGLAMVEFRMTPDGPVLMEINGRAWGSLALSVRAGLDFPLLAARLALYGEQPTHTDYVVGTECRNLELELRWIVAATRSNSHSIPRSEVLRSMLALFDPRSNFDVQVRDDFAVGLTDVYRSAKAVSSQALAQLTPRRPSNSGTGRTRR